jgi:hypothetical protein
VVARQLHHFNIRRVIVGKLRDSLTNASKLVFALQSAVVAYIKKLDTLAKEATDFRGPKGPLDNATDEFCLYVMEKLKKANIDVKSVENDPIKNHLDNNVANYLKGIPAVIQMAGQITQDFNAAANDQTVDRELTSLEKVLDDVVEQIRKKKKKLLQSKKYKAKIASYETQLGNLQQRVGKMKHTVEDLRAHPPASPQRLQQIFSITAETKLGDLLTRLSGSREALHKDYNSLVLKLNQTSNEIRKEAEFAEEMKVIKEMVDNSVDIEKESPD